ncbi:50S ribosomal protein L1 [Candidatus Peregrinibacteria bacterium]|jgi:large subunit ribosomal protein L1|nr:50S ribosomal protein L1 [Candidatus Peregrinibacteria bacterium]MBT7736984.1 50S ribosomal protein L1 [Candidatus Peregrinibacteria bacterium]
MSKHGKKYKEAASLIQEEAYSLDGALELLKKTSVTKFDSSCEVHMNLGVDPKQADQNIRTSVNLPHGTGKDVKVVAFVGDENIKAAKAAGAIEAGTEDLIEKIEKGWVDFDVAVATPDQMRSIGKIAKTLGQKGLMPNPKAGTVTPDFAKTIEELKKGKVEVRVDKNGNLHLTFGKVSFDDANLRENLLTIVRAVLEIKPSTLKGSYLKSMTITTSMGPGVPVELSSATEEAK